jgi:hypothetical protein
MVISAKYSRGKFKIKLLESKMRKNEDNLDNFIASTVNTAGLYV